MTPKWGAFSGVGLDNWTGLLHPFDVQRHAALQQHQICAAWWHRLLGWDLRFAHGLIPHIWIHRTVRAPKIIINPIVRLCSPRNDWAQNWGNPKIGRRCKVSKLQGYKLLQPILTLSSTVGSVWTSSCNKELWFQHVSPSQPKEALKSAAAPPSLAPKRCAKVAGNQNLAQATGTRGRGWLSKRLNHQLSGFRGIESDFSWD